MKFLFSAFLACLCFAASAQTPQPPEIAARSYLLLDVTANQILAAKDIDALLDYRKLTSARQEGPGWTVSRRDAQGKPSRWEFDCSTPGNKVCRGVWTRQLERHQKCMGMQ